MDNPKYLILDEPFEALDKKIKLITRNYLDMYLSKDPNRKFTFLILALGLNLFEISNVG